MAAPNVYINYTDVGCDGVAFTDGVAGVPPDVVISEITRIDLKRSVSHEQWRGGGRHWAGAVAATEKSLSIEIETGDIQALNRLVPGGIYNLSWILEHARTGILVGSLVHQVTNCVCLGTPYNSPQHKFTTGTVAFMPYAADDLNPLSVTVTAPA